MKIELKDISPIKKSLEVEVGPETVARETQEVLRGLAKQLRVPGFRKGKVPASVIRARFGKEVDEDVRDRLVARLYKQAYEKKGLEPLGQPVLEEVSQEEGQPFRFRTTLEVLPQFEVKSYKGVEVREQPVEIGDDDIDKALEELRQSRVQLVDEQGRAAATGDVLVADLRSTPRDDEPVKREKVQIELGDPHNHPSFNERLEGCKAGDTLEFAIDYPEEFEAQQLAGKHVAYKIEVHEVKRRQVPELDDEFAKDLGDFGTLAELKEKLGQDLLERRRAEARRALEHAVLDKVLLENPIPLPDVLVEQEIRQRLEDMVRAMVLQGIDPRKMELDWKELRDRQEVPARKSVHARLVLDALARTESIEVEKAEMEQRIRQEAQRAGEKVGDLRSRLRKKGGLEALRNQMVREKSLDLLTTLANIQREEQ